MNKTVKVISAMVLFLVHCFVMDSVDGGLIGFEYAVILAVFDLSVWCIFLVAEKKKSAASHTRNGQARKEHNKYNHHKFTPYKGGVSSGL